MEADTTNNDTGSEDTSLWKLSNTLFFPMKNNLPLPTKNVCWVETGTCKLQCYRYQASKDKNSKTLIIFHGSGELVSGYVNRPTDDPIPTFISQLKETGINLVHSILQSLAIACNVLIFWTKFSFLWSTEDSVIQQVLQIWKVAWKIAPKFSNTFIFLK